MKGYKQLNQEQRYTIARLLKRGASQREIARTIEVAVSIVSREINKIRASTLIVLHMPICSLESIFNGDSTLDVSRLI